MSKTINEVIEQFKSSHHEFYPSSAKDLCQVCGKFEEEHLREVESYLVQAYMIGQRDALIAMKDAFEIKE